MHAIVMAAGEGQRLRPLTECWPKPVLPIDGRPVIATLLRELAAAGCARATVVTGHLAEQVEALVGDGDCFGLEIVFGRQPKADGSADAVVRALAAGAEAPALVVAADTVFSRGDLLRFAEQAASSGAAGALAVRRFPPPDPSHRQRVQVADGRVVRVVDDDPANPLGSAPLWAIGPTLVQHVETACARPYQPPFELAAAYQLAIDAGEAIAAVEIGKTRDLTYPGDLVKENFPYLRS
jgi:NDP-sugar pyrophosphorylase family protein